MTDKPVLPLKEAYKFGVEKGFQNEIDRIRDMPIEWDLPYTSSLRRGYMTALFSEHDLLKEFKETYWPFGNTSGGQREIASYLRKKSRYEEFLQTGKEPSVEIDATEEQEDQSFAAESDLRDFLVKNLHCVEKGLRIYEGDGKAGAEFSIDEGRGRIDLLTIDSNDKLVVIELKLGQGRNRSLGQLLYYMGWVDAHLANPPCRGIIIAKEIPNDLILAAKRVAGISLCTYSLSVAINPVQFK